MRKIQIRTFFIMLLSGMILAGTSCKKDDNTKTKTDMLTAGNWKLTAINISPSLEIGGLQYSDIFGFLPDCSKDDLTKFNSNGSVNFDEGPIKCDAGSPQTTYGTWSFNADETKLTVIDSDGLPSENTISELTDATLKFTFTSVEDLGNGEKTYTVTYTFTKQ